MLKLVWCRLYGLCMNVRTGSNLNHGTNHPNPINHKNQSSDNL